MSRLRPLCALMLFLIAADVACADVGYSYVADQASYTGATGSMVTVKLYLVETVTQSGANQTSLINRYFANADYSVTYSGLASVGVGVEQTGLSGGGVTSQILGPSIFSPTVTSNGVTTNAGYNGVANNAGFTFGSDFSYDFTQRVSGGVSVSDDRRQRHFRPLPESQRSGHRLQRQQHSGEGRSPRRVQQQRRP